MSARGHAGAPETLPAIVLRSHATGEADLVVVLLTAARGRVECHARGARKSRRRFPGGLPSGARGEATLGVVRRGSLPPLEAFAATGDHLALGRDLEAFAFVGYLCELADRLVAGHDAEGRAFALLDEAIAGTAAALPARVRPHPVLLRRFELGLLAALGELPVLERCSVCGGAADRTSEGVSFSPARGGVLCLEHARGNPRRLSAPLLDAAVALLDGAIGARELPELDREVRRGLRDLGRELIEPHLRSPLRSLAFFAQLPPGIRASS